jgi:LPXTG-site transpeptidase (sortase) family protein
VNGARDLARFERTGDFEGGDFEGNGHNAPFEDTAGTDTTLWSSSRLALYRSSPRPAPEELVGALVIRGLDLKAPLYVDTSELHLNRGVGLIAKMAVPGETGNLGIAGHRDGFFRSLKDIRLGETIEVLTRDRAWRYRVFSIEVVERSDASLLQRSEQPTVTLVTCHPFYFVGRAPGRFVVRGALLSSQPYDPPGQPR